MAAMNDQKSLEAKKERKLDHCFGIISTETQNQDYKAVWVVYIWPYRLNKAELISATLGHVG